MRTNVLDKGLANGTINSLGPIAGMAIAGGISGLLGGGGGGGTSSSSSTEMPEWLKDKYDDPNGPLARAETLFQEGPQDYYGGDMVADLDPATMQGLSMTEGLAMNDTLNPTAGGYAESVLGGDYLGGDQFMDAYGQDILEGVDSRFGAAGRGGSGYNSKVATSELGDAASRLYGQERDRQQQTLGNIPALTDSAYTGADKMVNSGALLQSQAQDEINADVNKFNFEENAEQERIGTYMDFLGQVPAGSTTNTTNSGPESNPLIAGIGGAMQGASIGSNWGGG